VIRLRRLLRISLATLLLAIAQPGMASPPRWQDGQQLITVISADWDATSARLQRHERHGDAWRNVGDPVDVSLGRSGSAWGRGLHPRQDGPQKREGDGRAPAGLFAIGVAFGSATSAATGLEYQTMQASHYCIDVPDSPLYTRIVDAQVVGIEAIKGSTEPMRRDLQSSPDDLYQLGFVIEHNADAAANAGSCIFAHVWRGPDHPTAGCTAMSLSHLQALLGWLNKEHQPRFVLLPAERYAALVSEWDLPSRVDAINSGRVQ